MTDRELMNEALRLAKEAYSDGEVPVGAVIALNGEIVSTGRNRREKLKNALSHAEIEAINSACEKLGRWRLDDCVLYVTLEPCPMCAGAIVLARLDAVVWGVGDPKRGGGTAFGIFDHPGINHHPAVVAGICEMESKAMLRGFFQERRIR